MSNNNFLKISIFNLEQKIKQQAEQQVKLLEKELEQVDYLVTKISDRDYPEKDKTYHRLQSYKAYLEVIRVGNVNLFNFIDQYYKFGDQQVAEFCDARQTDKTIKSKPITTTTKKLPKKRITKKPKSPKQPKKP